MTIKLHEVSIVDKGFEEGWIVPQPPVLSTGKSVAIIGSGPAGLACAQQLNSAGHTVAVFERDAKPGCLLRYGIPDFKLEKQILDRRIDILEQEGTTSLPTVRRSLEVSGRLSAPVEPTPAVVLAGPKLPALVEDALTRQNAPPPEPPPRSPWQPVAWAAAGAVAGGGIVLSTERLRETLRIDPDNRLAVVSPGFTNQELQDAAAAHGFFWPPDPTSAATCTIGGNLAYNSAGPRAVKYGTPRENTLGLRAGDVLLALDGREVEGADQARRILADMARLARQEAELLAEGKSDEFSDKYGAGA